MSNIVVFGQDVFSEKIKEQFAEVFGVGYSFNDIRDFYSKLRDILEVEIDSILDEEVRTSAKSRQEKAKELIKLISLEVGQKAFRDNNAYAMQLYPQIIDQQRILEYKEKVEGLAAENKRLEEIIERLKKELTTKYSKELEEERNQVLRLYKPKKNLWIPSVSLSILTLFTQSQSMYEKLSSFSPLDPEQTKWIISGITVTLIICLFYKTLGYFKVKSMIDVTLNSKTAEEFSNILYENGDAEKVKEFSEKEAYRFLEAKFKSTVVKRFILKTLFLENSFESLKDYFLHRLVERKLIQPYGSKKLSKNYKVADSPYAWYSY